jgi:ABC-type phosphate/phosphonate transport system substrate-binding protein
MCKIKWLLYTLTTVAAMSAAPAQAELVLGTQPRGAYDKFGPPFEQVAAYLSKEIGEKVVYRHAREWISYARDLKEDKYDIVFDEAHFVAWRIANKQHTLVAAAVPEASEKLAVIVKRDDNKLFHVGQLAGRTVCGMGSPNLATLSLLTQFPNPIRVPLMITVDSYDAAYRGVTENKCAAAVLSDLAVERLNKMASSARTIFIGERLMPGDAFTVGPRVRPDVRGRILQALLSPDTASETKLFIDRYAFGKLLDLPVEEQYRGLEAVLKEHYGF